MGASDMAAPTVAPAAALTLPVRRVVSAGEFAAVHAGDRVIVLRCRPSAAAARTARALLSHIASLHLTIRHGEVRAVLHGVDHRLPVERSCTLSGALALAEAGLATTITTDHTIGEGVDPR